MGMNAVRLANAVRNRVGNKLPVDVVVAAQYFDIDVVYGPALQVEYTAREHKCFVLPETMSDARRRLMTAQLLGLHFFDKAKTSKPEHFFKQTLAKDTGILNTKCRLADLFALEMLVPEKLLQKLMNTHSVSSLSTFFGVEEQVIQTRLRLLKPQSQH